MADEVATVETKKRKRRAAQYVLGWVNETAAEKDEPSRRCFVELELPPTLDQSKPVNREAVKRACRKAVYDLGLESYGNKDLVVLSLDEVFRVEFEKQEVVRLCPPKNS